MLAALGYSDFGCILSYPICAYPFPHGLRARRGGSAVSRPPRAGPAPRSFSSSSSSLQNRPRRSTLTFRFSVSTHFRRLTPEVCIRPPSPLLPPQRCSCPSLDGGLWRCLGRGAQRIRPRRPLLPPPSCSFPPPRISTGPLWRSTTFKNLPGTMRPTRFLGVASCVGPACPPTSKM